MFFVRQRCAKRVRASGATREIVDGAGGATPGSLRLTLDKLPDHASGERPRGSKAVPYPKARLAEGNAFGLLCQLD
jgi:hypothetical protein